MISATKAMERKGEERGRDLNRYFDSLNIYQLFLADLALSRVKIEVFVSAVRCVLKVELLFRIKV